MPAEELWDPYEILRVTRNAPLARIKHEFRERVKECHPDLGGGDERAEQFKRVVWAYRALERVAREADDAPEAPAPEAPRPRGGSRVEELLEAARENLTAGIWQQAETLSRLAIRSDPRSAEAYLILARALAHRNNYAEAIGCLLLALHMDPDREDVRTELTALRNRGVATSA